MARGETLWGIAREYSKGSGYSINQAMLALQRKNPEAFIKDNINSLKRGAILRLPAFSELGELSSQGGDARGPAAGRGSPHRYPFGGT